MQRKNSITPADVLDGGFEAYVERSGPPLPPEHTRLTGDAAPSGAVRAAVLVSAGRVTPCVWGMVCPELPKRPSATHHSGGEPLRTGRFSVPRPSRAGYISYSCRPHRTCATQAAVIESPVYIDVETPGCGPGVETWCGGACVQRMSLRNGGGGRGEAFGGGLRIDTLALMARNCRSAQNRSVSNHRMYA